MYVHLPLLAYLTDFQILPSVYDAVKKNTDIQMKMLMQMRGLSVMQDHRIFMLQLSISCCCIFWVSLCCMTSTIQDESSIRDICLMLLSMLAHIREMSMTQEHTTMLRDSPGHLGAVWTIHGKSPLCLFLLHIVEETCSIIPIGYVLQVLLSQCCGFRT